MNSRLGVVIGSALFVIAILAALVYMSIGYHQYEVEVCITFKGRTQCRTASATEETAARRAASDNACALIS